MKKITRNEKENIELAKALENEKGRLKLKEEVLYMNKKKIMNELETKKRSRHIKFVPVFTASLLLVFSMLATSVLAFPGIAAKVVPNIPLVKEISERDLEIENIREAEQIKQVEIEELRSEIEELKMTIKKISDEQIKEVETSPNEDEEQNFQLQTLVVEFVKEMYRGNYEKAAQYCTEEFAQTVIDSPQDVIMRPSSNAVVFTQITNVAKVDDSMFLVFLRLNDSGEDMEADYQLDFEIVMKDDAFLISFVGIDA